MSEDEEPKSNFSSAQQDSVIPLGWKPTAAKPVPVVRCIQIKKDGARCKSWSLRGYNKCKKHAGPGALMKDGNVQKYAEAVIEAARLRLVDDSETALDILNQLMQPGTSEQIRLKAATEVLDRAGVRGGFDVKVDVEVTQNPSDEVRTRLAELAKGAKTVEDMKAKALAESEAERAEAENIIDAEVVEEPTDEQ
jgi:hypothetical protein